MSGIRVQPALPPPQSATVIAHHPLSAVRDWTTRHPLAAFLILVFGLAYPLMAVPILAMHGLIPGRGLIDRLPITPDGSPVSCSPRARCYRPPST